MAVICEYDALPDIGHACGHNLIAEVGVGAALGVKAAMDASDDRLGKVTCNRLILTILMLKCSADRAGDACRRRVWRQD